MSYTQKYWRIEFTNGSHETVFGVEPVVSKDRCLVVVHEYYGGGGLKDRRSFVLSNVKTWRVV